MGNIITSNNKPTEKGYIRISKNGQRKYLHTLIWEQHNGPLPKGYQLHHIDHNPHNNSLDNLLPVTPIQHRRLHAGFSLDPNDNSKWLKTCPCCKQTLPATPQFFQFSKSRINSKLCLSCLKSQKKIKYLQNKQNNHQPQQTL